ncbi:glycosyltransferase [Cytobacillus firmus]|uniref:glycosyltransferase n=1 Tax=Cytobacillus firmus TaxID=1399 RepID=UPI002FFE203A
MTIDLPLVSVIIPFYNCGYINQAIESVLLQTYPNIEIIVVDDGSSANIELLEPYLSEIAYYQKPNGGVASALNHGLKNASGEYTAWLSSDDLFDKHKIERQTYFMMEKGSTISFTNFNLIDENNAITKFNVGKAFADELEVLQTMSSFNPINGCTVMMSKKVQDRIGYFDETLKYAQDYEYWIRTALAYPIHYLHATLTNYRVHDKMGSIRHGFDQRQEFYMVREKYNEAINQFLAEKGYVQNE